MEQDLIARLQKRAEIRRSASTRKSVQEGQPDRIADLLEEAAAEITYLRNLHKLWLQTTTQLLETVSKDD
jgi:hypothetical protein